MENYLILVDRGHLAIFAPSLEPGQYTPKLTKIEEMEFPAAFRRTVDEVTDLAGRFPGSKGGHGMSIDERLPMQEEREHRIVRLIADEVTHFLQARPKASWIFVAAVPLHQSVLKQIDGELKRRLRRIVPKDLVKASIADLRDEFFGRRVRASWA